MPRNITEITRYLKSLKKIDDDCSGSNSALLWLWAVLSYAIGIFKDVRPWSLFIIVTIISQIWWTNVLQKCLVISYHIISYHIISYHIISYHIIIYQYFAGMSPADVREACGNAGLSPPFLGKSLWADGRPGSHGLLVVKDLDGLDQILNGPRPKFPTLPMIIQQYTPHGACLFKVHSFLVKWIMMHVSAERAHAVLKWIINANERIKDTGCSEVSSYACEYILMCE